MDTNLIRQFCAVIESGTISRAADALNMTPGALSRALKRLEDELEVPLFNRDGRNIAATSEAIRFYSLGKEILENIKAAKISIKVPVQKITPIRIASFEVFSSHFMAHFISSEKIKVPLTLLEKGPMQIEEAVKNHVCDIGITYIPFLDPQLDHLSVGFLINGVFSNTKNRLIDLPFAVPTSDVSENIVGATSLDGWPTHTPREINFRFELLETALDLASRGLCRVYCPKFFAALENERLNPSHRLVEVNLENKFRYQKSRVYLVKRKSDSESDFFKKLAKRLRIVLKEQEKI